MRTRPWVRRLSISSAILAVSCPGVAPRCTTDADCQLLDLSAYCNHTAQACFIRSGTIPTISGVAVGPLLTQLTVSGTASANSIVRIFVNAQCMEPNTNGSGTADGTGNFSIATTVTNASGTVYANADSNGIESMCSDGVPYPVSLIVNPRTATIDAGGGAVAFAATLTGSSNAISWTLTGPGSISTSTGPSTAYTPPPSVSVPTTATLTASAGVNLYATASITVNPAGITVNPQAVTLFAGGPAVDFMATVGASSDTVAWTLAGPGTINTSTGLITA